MQTAVLQSAALSGNCRVQGGFCLLYDSKTSGCAVLRDKGSVRRKQRFLYIPDFYAVQSVLYKKKEENSDRFPVKLH